MDNIEHMLTFGMVWGPSGRHSIVFSEELFTIKDDTDDSKTTQPVEVLDAVIFFLTLA